MVVDGQIHGGLAQGIGTALMEVIEFDEEGNHLNSNFMDYLMPTSMEVPNYELGEFVTPSTHHPARRPRRCRVPDGRVLPPRWSTPWWTRSLLTGCAT